ncbi:ABC transporter ATP-binding protein [Tumebacillus permanentifrigoris]|uniref:ABC-2 type transport system ATP-binding protein n=1 Tax=Tumebacillus permanentifrigoris TaxID=378543 RepID=A0A316DAH3_9BACL|nr:ABC transporter ATP-binding protein [Tumebacillus permanentifrigoris]PWK13812.1 ABC-2 type transport system ATP-binding protein [Tumebacillus permanentifrigoris]
MNQPYIQVEHVSKRFGAQQVLDDMNFTVRRGEIVGLLGPNGSGKTTMIRLLNGVILPDRGTIRVGTHNPALDGDPIRRQSGILTEGAGLYHELSGLENLKFFAKLHGVQDKQRLLDLLEQFDLTAHMHKLVGTYSTGMKKRLGLAKALIHRPELLFLDEPTNGLDPEGIQLVMKYIRDLNRAEGTTILLCSHVLHTIEEVCHAYIFMENGRVLEQGTNREIEDKYVTETILRVETGLVPTGEMFAGVPVQRVGSQSLQFTLPNKAAITPLLQAILRESWVHEAVITNRDLEALYFKVRRESHE